MSKDAPRTLADQRKNQKIDEDFVNTMIKHNRSRFLSRTRQGLMNHLQKGRNVCFDLFSHKKLRMPMIPQAGLGQGAWDFSKSNFSQYLRDKRNIQHSREIPEKIVASLVLDNQFQSPLDQQHHYVGLREFPQSAGERMVRAGFLKPFIEDEGDPTGIVCDVIEQQKVCGHFLPQDRFLEEAES
jgi:hypothetical protein